MARQLRVHPPGGIHHITARGNDRSPIFLCDADRHSMLEIVGDAIDRHRCRLLAFCLMDNHVHFTMEDLDGDLSKALKHVNGVYAQRFNRRHGRTGHLFGGRFWNSLIETDSYLATAVEYVHRNPVEACIVEQPAKYRWSSYRSYAGLERPSALLSMDLVLGLYGFDRKLLRSRTERDVRDVEKERQLAKPWPEPVLGSDAFVERHRPPVIKTAPVIRRVETRNGALTDVVAAVAEVFDTDVAQILTPRPGARNEPRMLAVYVTSVVCGVPNAEVARHFSMSATNSVSSVSARCLEAVEKRPRMNSALLAVTSAVAEHARAA